MKKLLMIIVLSLMWSGNTFAEKFKLPDGLEFTEEKSFVEKTFDKFKKNKKSKKIKTFSLTCEGEILNKMYDDYVLVRNEKEIFFEDFEIEVSTLNDKKEISEGNSFVEKGQEIIPDLLVMRSGVTEKGDKYTISYPITTLQRARR